LLELEIGRLRQPEKTPEVDLLDLLEHPDVKERDESGRDVTSDGSRA
jgi:hypothetical protein